MEPLKIGFLGGCINNQKGIALEEFYYSVFDSLLSATPHVISAGTYYTFDKMAEKAGSFSELNNLDILCLWIRQFPLMPMHKPLIKYENKSGGISWSAHPALFKPLAKWNPELTRYHTQNEYVYKRRLRFEKRDVNLLAGKLLGLHTWARKFINREIDKVSEYCKRNNIKLLVISPQQCPSSIMGNNVCKTISASIERYSAKQNIAYLNIINLGKDYYANDNVHFNAACHKLLAHMIYDWIKENLVAKKSREKINETVVI